MKVTRIITGALSASLLGLSLLAFAPHTHSTSNEPVWHATWIYHPQSLGEARAKASEVVLARVSAVAAGPDIVVPVEGEPNGEDRIPTQRISVEVLKSYKGKTSSTLTIFHTGTDTNFIEGDPGYQVGETYLFFVEPKADEPGTHLLISPEGRYRVVNNKLEAVTHDGIAPQLHGKPLAEIERAVASEK
jgi:hypothetical protein